MSYKSSRSSSRTTSWEPGIDHKLRVSIYYKGAVYRIRGAKVICSVISIVLLLLFATLGMGIWMLVSAYGQDKVPFTPSRHNITEQRGTETGLPDLSMTGIEFGDEVASFSHYNVSGNDLQDRFGSVPNYESWEIKFPPFFPSFKKPTSSLAPDPKFGLFRSVSDEVVEDFLVNKNKPTFAVNSDETISRKGEAFVDDTFFKKNFSDDLANTFNQNLPQDTVPLDTFAKTFEVGSFFATQNLTPIVPEVKQTAENLKLLPFKTEIEYRHPLPYGYIHSNSQFNSYSAEPSLEAHRNDSSDIYPQKMNLNRNLFKFKIPVGYIPTSDEMVVPSRRGDFVGYDAGLPIRPDAELPEVDPDRIVWKEMSKNFDKMAESKNQFSYYSPPNSQYQDIYDYSKHLTSAIFDMSSPSHFKDDEIRDNFVRQSMKLLSDYDRLFQSENETKETIVSASEPTKDLKFFDVEALTRLDPFEMSLVAWTFLDFWEFLIEKVGTLSEQDLKQLQQRLDKFRKGKDREMAKSLIEEEVTTIQGRSMSNVDSLQSTLWVAFIGEENKKSDFTSDQNTTYSVTKQGQKTISNQNTLNDTKDPFNVTQMFDAAFQEEANTEILTPESEKNSHETGRSLSVFPTSLLDSEQRVTFMKFAVGVIFKFGRVYLEKEYAIDCMMLLFCKDLNKSTRKIGVSGIASKLKSVGLKVLTEKQGRETDTIGEVWRALTAWEPMQCEAMFPRCDGEKALEIVNEVANGGDQ